MRAPLAADAGEPAAVVAGQAACPAAAGAAQLARAGQVHLPERRERLHARHAGAAAVLARAPRLQPRLHPARGSGALRRMGAARPAGLDAPEDRRGDAGRAARPASTSSSRSRSCSFYDTVHVNSEKAWCSSSTTSTATIARSTPRSRAAIPTRSRNRDHDRTPRLQQGSTSAFQSSPGIGRQGVVRHSLMHRPHFFAASLSLKRAPRRTPSMP